MPDGKADGSAKPPRAPDESKAPGKNVCVVPTSRGARLSSLTNAKCTQSGIFEMPAVRWHGTCATTPGRKICSQREEKIGEGTGEMTRLTKSPGPTPTAPAPAVAGQTDRVVYQEGRWQLFGDGRNTPYYWVWVPAGGDSGTTASPERRSGAIGGHLPRGTLAALR